ncbi:hypothetical protein HID58_054211 [Brassica napus]|uniref:Uncharacterized protein n=1 Tax=Brassica napus TaxID=3708 RepID=A0ABQ8AGW1_BRANA|nr:hypothetical protein HID58_054211 [Brassica napus]
MNQSSGNPPDYPYIQRFFWCLFVVEKPQGPYTSPPPIGYPTRDAAAGDPVVAAVETKSKGDGFWSCISEDSWQVLLLLPATLSGITIMRLRS